jgi:predicted HD phosphohydrolase
MFLDGTFPNLLRKSFHVTVSDAEPCYHTRTDGQSTKSLKLSHSHFHDTSAMPFLRSPPAYSKYWGACRRWRCLVLRG